jgi:hypothetical protein
MIGETEGAMKKNEASKRLGKIVVSEVAKLPALQALAIFFETGQGAPVFYFAYETVEHALKRLNDFADTKIADMRTHRNDLASKGAQADIDRIDSELSALPYLRSRTIGDHCNVRIRQPADFVEGSTNASSRPRPPIGPCRRKATNIAPHARSGAIRVLVLACSSDRLGAFGSANPRSSVASLSCSAPTVASCATPCRRPYDVSTQ